MSEILFWKYCQHDIYNTLQANTQISYKHHIEKLKFIAANS